MTEDRDFERLLLAAFFYKRSQNGTLHLPQSCVWNGAGDYTKGSQAGRHLCSRLPGMVHSSGGASLVVEEILEAARCRAALDILLVTALLFFGFLKITFYSMYLPYSGALVHKHLFANRHLVKFCFCLQTWHRSTDVTTTIFPT